jgi:hypothetical protein
MPSKVSAQAHFDTNFTKKAHAYRVALRSTGKLAWWN